MNVWFDGTIRVVVLIIVKWFLETKKESAKYGQVKNIKILGKPH
jgi:hypothetical protein